MAGLAPADAGHDMAAHATGGVSCRHRGRAEGAEIGRAVEIRRFDPALAGACHAANQGRDAGRLRGEGIERCGKLFGPKPGHAPIGAAFKDRPAVGVDAPDPQFRGSPVNRDPLGLAAHFGPLSPPVPVCPPDAGR